jgi:hypothetical protein
VTQPEWEQGGETDNAQNREPRNVGVEKYTHFAQSLKRANLIQSDTYTHDRVARITLNKMV